MRWNLLSSNIKTYKRRLRKSGYKYEIRVSSQVLPRHSQIAHLCKVCQCRIVICDSFNKRIELRGNKLVDITQDIIETIDNVYVIGDILRPHRHYDNDERISHKNDRKDVCEHDRKDVCEHERKDLCEHERKDLCEHECKDLCEHDRKDVHDYGEELISRGGQNSVNWIKENVKLSCEDARRFKYFVRFGTLHL